MCLYAVVLCIYQALCALKCDTGNKSEYSGYPVYAVVFMHGFYSLLCWGSVHLVCDCISPCCRASCSSRPDEQLRCRCVACPPHAYYGMLVVCGALVTEDDSRWEGLCSDPPPPKIQSHLPHDMTPLNFKKGLSMSDLIILQISHRCCLHHYGY